MGIVAMPPGTATNSISQRPAPDLNLLRSRVEAFWKLRQQGRKQEALNYVDPSCRKYFMGRDEQKFLSFSLAQMRFIPNSSSVIVTVDVRLLFPQFLAPVDSPVEETYVFRNGNWYAQVAPAADLKQLFQDSKEPKSANGPSPEVVAKMRKELDQLEIKPEQIQLGELRQGDSKVFSVGYKNPGTLPARVKINKAPPGLSVNSLIADIYPGKSGTLLFTLDTTYLDGKISDKIAFLVSNEGAEITRELPIEGYVKAPLSFTPPHLVLGQDSRCEVSIKNQTQQVIQINASNLPDFMSIEGPPIKTIDPGATATVVIVCDRGKIPSKWPGSNIIFEFGKPIDGWERSPLLVLPEKP